MRKFILIPEYRPLYAMGKCFGPTHGPLTKPCPVPVDIIGELLMQTGNEKVSIFEVLKNHDGSTSTPVELTLENYKLPYEELVGQKEDPDPIQSAPDPEPVQPVIVTVVPDPEPEAAPVPVVTPEESVAPEEPAQPEVVVPEAPTEEKEDEPEEEEVEKVVETQPEVQVVSQKLTKAERKAARRAAAAAAAQNAASSAESANN